LGGWRGEGARDKVTKRRRGKERVEWGRGPWRAVLAFLPRGFRVPSYATDTRPIVDPPHTSATAERRLQIMQRVGYRQQNYAKVGHRGWGRGHVTGSKFPDPIFIRGTSEAGN